MDFIQSMLFLVGRVALSVFFLYAVLEKVRNWDTMLVNFKAKHIPQAQIVLPVMALLQLLGGVSLMFGYHAHIGSFLLILTVLPSLIFFHRFWKSRGEEKARETTLFMKNIAILGALFIMLAIGGHHFIVR